jgi:hypothetical protein
VLCSIAVLGNGLTRIGLGPSAVGLEAGDVLLSWADTHSVQPISPTVSPNPTSPS